MPPSPQIIPADPADIEHHAPTQKGRQETARVWRHSALAGVELFQGRYRKHDFAPHYHGTCTIGVVEHGVMSSRHGRTRHVAPAGSILLYNAGEVHAPGPANNDAWSFRTFYLEDAVLRRGYTAPGARALSFAQPVVLEDRAMAANLLRLHRTLEQSASSLEAESSLVEILVALAQRYGSVSRDTVVATREPSKISKVRDYIHAHFSQDVSLAKLAQISEFSEYHLLRTFRRTVGLTPHAYLIQTRVEAAKKLLRAGMGLAGIAVSTGFVDQSHFNRHFKRLVGATPGQYHSELRFNRSAVLRGT